MKKSSRIILIVIGIIAIAIPIVGMFIDFGTGTDNQAGEQIMQIQSLTEDPNTHLFGLEPSETAEPWLFVLQIVIGIVLFYIGLRAWNQSKKKESK